MPEAATVRLIGKANGVGLSRDFDLLAAALAAILRRYSASPRQRHRPDLSAHYIENVSPAIIDVYRTLIAERTRAPDA